MAKFTQKTMPVPVADNEAFNVSGLSLTDIVQLVDVHRDALEEGFNRFSGRDPNSVTENEAMAVVMDMLQKVPPLAAHIISISAKDIENYADYLDLPLGVQIDALQKIGELTFASGGGPKKIFDLAMKAARARVGSSTGPQT
jgi:hypothetical protein